MNSIERQRIQNFEYNFQHIDVYNEMLMTRFKRLNDQLPDEYIAWIVLTLFEYVLFNNYLFTGHKKLQTKCNIDTRIVLSNAEFSGDASILLNVLYKLRNSYAHDKLSCNSVCTDLRAIIRDIKSIQTLQSILRLIMPVEYPACLDNIYYLVKRDIDNPNYIKLKEDMFTELKLPNKTVKQVLDKFNSEVNESIRNQALLEVLGNYGLTDEEKQEA